MPSCEAPTDCVGELTAVVTDFGDLVRDDQMMGGINCRLDLVADHAGSLAVGRYLLVWRDMYLDLQRPEAFICSLRAAILSFRRAVLAWMISRSFRSAVSSANI